MKRVLFKSREYIHSRTRNESYLEPHQRAIELVDVEDKSTIRIDVSRVGELAEVVRQQPPRMLTDLFPLEPIHNVPFAQRPKDFLLAIRQHRIEISLKSKRAKVAREKKPKEPKLPKQPKDPSAPRKPRKVSPRKTKISVDPLAAVKAELAKRGVGL